MKRQLKALRRSPEFGVFQLNEYIHAFRSSSDRARYVIFITTAISLLMLMADWNYLNWSWSRQGRNLYEERRKAQLASEWLRQRQEASAWTRIQAEADRRIAELSRAKKVDRTLLDTVRSALVDLRVEQMRLKTAPKLDALDEELAKQWDLEWWGGQMREFYSRAVFVPVPGLGASVHVNDIALVGGVVLLALAGLLWASLVRQHENLYLASFKIHQICRLEERSQDRDSVANFLYHALAMAQVLSYPPSLARWNYGLRHRISGALVALVYLFPVIAQGTIVFQNVRSRDKALDVWGRHMTHLRLSMQTFLGVAILVFCVLALYYARSCTKRWRKMFFTINRNLERVEQRPWLEWVNIVESPLTEDERRLARELTYELDIVDTRPPTRPASASRGRREMKPRRWWHVSREVVRYARGFIKWPYRDQYFITQRELEETCRELAERCTGGKRRRFRGPMLHQNRLVVEKRKVKQWDVTISVQVPAADEEPPVQGS